MASHSKGIYVSACALAVVILLLIVFLSISITSFEILKTKHLPFKFIGPRVPVSIGCFKNNKVRKIQVNKTIGISVYSIDESKLSNAVMDHPLSESQFDPFIAAFNETIHLNYYGDEDPLYAATQGYIVFEVSSRKDVPNKCALQIIMFDDYNQFQNIFHNKDFIAINETCLSAAKAEQLHKIEFSLPMGKPIYFAGNVIKGVELNFSIHGFVTEFDVDEMNKESCSENSCTISISQSRISNSLDFNKKCVLIQLGPSNENNVWLKTKVDKVEADSLSVGFTTLSVTWLIFAVSLLGICYLVRRRNIKKNRNYTRISNNSTSESTDSEEEHHNVETPFFTLQVKKQKPRYSSTDSTNIQQLHTRPITCTDDGQRTADEDATKLPSTHNTDHSERNYLLEGDEASSAGDNNKFDSKSIVLPCRQSILNKNELPVSNDISKASLSDSHSE